MLIEHTTRAEASRWCGKDLPSTHVYYTERTPEQTAWKLAD